MSRCWSLPRRACWPIFSGGLHDALGAGTVPTKRAERVNPGPVAVGEVQIESVAARFLDLNHVNVRWEGLGIEEWRASPLIDAGGALALLAEQAVRIDTLVAVAPLDQECARLEKLDGLRLLRVRCGDHEKPSHM